MEIGNVRRNYTRIAMGRLYHNHGLRAWRRAPAFIISVVRRARGYIGAEPTARILDPSEARRVAAAAIVAGSRTANMRRSLVLLSILLSVGSIRHNVRLQPERRNRMLTMHRRLGNLNEIGQRVCFDLERNCTLKLIHHFECY
ncbi:unnamed protein product, partial [Trichogramma brassicae]